MPDGFTIDPQGVGIVGLCVLFVLALAKGWLYTSRQYGDVVHDRDEWRAESRIKDQQISEKDEQLRHLREGYELTKSVVHGVRASASESEAGR